VAPEGFYPGKIGYNYLDQHRLEWIAPSLGNAARGLPDGIPVIEQITILRIEESQRSRDPSSRSALPSIGPKHLLNRSCVPNK
jgi:hypothetical protein